MEIDKLTTLIEKYHNYKFKEDEDVIVSNSYHIQDVWVCGTFLKDNGIDSVNMHHYKIKGYSSYFWHCLPLDLVKSEIINDNELKYLRVLNLNDYKEYDKLLDKSENFWNNYD